MVEIAPAERQTLGPIHHREAPLANVGDDDRKAGVELRLAIQPLHRALGRRGVIGGDRTILAPLTKRGEWHVGAALFVGHAGEVAVADARQLRPTQALVDRY